MTADRGPMKPDRLMRLGVEAMSAESVPLEGIQRTLAKLGLDPAAATHVGPRRVVRARFLILRPAALFSVLMGVFVLWYAYIEQDPNIPVPTPAVPTENAFRYFVAAAQATEEGWQRSQLDRRRTASTGPETTLTLAEKKKLLAAQDRALRFLRAGLAYPYYEPPVRTFEHGFPYYSGYRELARLLATEADVHAAEGRFEQAARSHLDAIDLGSRIPRGAPLVGRFVGIACEAIGRNGLWPRLERLNARECRQVVARLEEIEGRRVPLRETLDEEVVMTVAALQHFMRQRNWRMQLTSLTGSSHNSWLLFLTSLTRSKSDFVREYVEVARRTRERLERYPDRFLPEPPYASLSPIGELGLVPLNTVAFKDALNEAETRLILVSAAVRAYQLERGQAPRTLTELVKARYLQRMPEDPFAPPGTTLRLISKDGKPVVYSIGPDLKDDGGRPAIRRAASDEGIVHVQPDSWGDVVAGINK